MKFRVFQRIDQRECLSKLCFYFFVQVFTANSQLDAEAEAELDEIYSQREEAQRKRSRGTS